MIPTTGKNCKKTHEERRTCPGWFNVELYNKTYFPLRIFSAAMVTVKMSFTHFHSCIGNILLHQTMQPISLNYHWDNGVKQIKITAKKLVTKLYLVSIAKGKDPSIGVKMHPAFFLFLPLFALYPLSGGVDVIYLICLVFIKSSCWLV